MGKNWNNRRLSPRERARVRDPKTLLARARAMRHEASDAERMLWRHLRARRLAGFKFRRQEVIGPYIVDLVCFHARLIIEADGGQHAEQQVYDQQRSAALAAKGYRVLRFWNNEILNDIDGVLERIRIELCRSPHPDPLPGGRGRLGVQSMSVDPERPSPLPQGEGD